MNVTSIADISGDNAKHQISTTNVQAVWVAFTVVAASGVAAARVGDTNVSSSRGAAVVTNTRALVFPPRDAGPGAWDMYNLANLYAYVPSGVTLTITYGTTG